MSTSIYIGFKTQSPMSGTYAGIEGPRPVEIYRALAILDSNDYRRCSLMRACVKLRDYDIVESWWRHHDSSSVAQAAWAAMQSFEESEPWVALLCKPRGWRWGTAQPWCSFFDKLYEDGATRDKGYIARYLLACGVPPEKVPQIAALVDCLYWG